MTPLIGRDLLGHAGLFHEARHSFGVLLVAFRLRIDLFESKLLSTHEVRNQRGTRRVGKSDIHFWKRELGCGMACLETTPRTGWGTLVVAHAGPVLLQHVEAGQA